MLKIFPRFELRIYLIHKSVSAKKFFIYIHSVSSRLQLVLACSTVVTVSPSYEKGSSASQLMASRNT